MGYTGIENTPAFIIDKIYSVHYFEYAANFSFAGESHDFWEFLCVDKGNVEIIAGEDVFTLNPYDIFFHEPNEFHAVHTDGKTAPNLVVVSFSCNHEILHLLKHKILHITQAERNILGKLILEARRCFDCRLDDPYLKTIPLKDSMLFGSSRSVFLYLEQFLIQMIRKNATQQTILPNENLSIAKSTKAATDTQLFNEIIKYVSKNLACTITIDSLCEHFSISRSRLQKLFKRRCNLGVIEYITHTRIDTAKEMIRMQYMNFSQIATELGYSSVHYFSRQFKKTTGMTPTEYATSIKLIFENE